MRRYSAWTVVLVLGVTMSAGGQGNKPRVAGIAPAPPPAAAPPSEGQHRQYWRRDYGYGTVPVIMDGGYVYADFGYGYERVLRSCAATYGSGYVQPGYSPPAYTPPAYTPPTYTPPQYTPPSYSASQQPAATAPAQAQQAPDAQQPAATADRRPRRTAGIAPIPPQPAPHPPSYGRGPACWVTDAYGRIFVVRP